MKRHLSKKEKRELEHSLTARYGDHEYFSKRDSVEVVDERVVFVNGFPSFFYFEKQLFPTLKYLQDTILLKSVTVDMGAIKFVTNGADVMRPGITAIDDGILKGEVVVVVDETHNKPLAIAKMLFSGDEVERMTHGKVLKSIHHVGDEIWGYL